MNAAASAPSCASTSRFAFHPKLFVLFGLHLALDFVLISPGWVWSEPMLMMALALPLSQVSLLTVGAMTVWRHPLLRFLAPLGGIVACWFVMSRLLPWGTGDAASAGWALALVVQVVTLCVAVAAAARFRIFRPSVELMQGEVAEVRPMRFGLGSLMLWMTVMGCGFGFIRFGQSSWQWTTAVFQWELIGAMPIIGVTNGLVAALWLWSLSAARLAGMGFRTAIALGLTGVLVLVVSHATELVTQTTVLGLHEFGVLLTAQSLIVAVSLAIAKPGFIPQ